MKSFFLRCLPIVLMIVITFTACTPTATPGESNDYDDAFFGVKTLTKNVDNYNSEEFISAAKLSSEIAAKTLLVMIAAEYGLGVEESGYSFMIGENSYPVFKNGEGYLPFGAGLEPKYSHENAISSPAEESNPLLSSMKWNISEPTTKDKDVYMSEFLDTYYEEVQLFVLYVYAGLNPTKDAVYKSYTGAASGTDISGGIDSILGVSGADALVIDGERCMVSRIGLNPDDYEHLENYVIKYLIGDSAWSVDTFNYTEDFSVSSPVGFSAEEFIDGNGNGIYDEGELFDDLNKDGKFSAIGDVELGKYDKRKDYFKNYEKNIDVMIDNLREIMETSSEFNAVTFPQSSMMASDIKVSEFNDEGMKNYSSITILAKERVEVLVLLSITSEVDLDLSISFRHVKDGVSSIESLGAFHISSEETEITLETFLDGARDYDSSEGELIKGSGVYELYDVGWDGGEVIASLGYKNFDYTEIIFTNDSGLPFKVDMPMFVFGEDA